MEALLDQTDEFLIGGLMAYTFLKAQGQAIGQTLIEENFLSQARDFIERLEGRDKKIFLPVDFIVEEKGQIKTVNLKDFPKTGLGRDIGPKSQQIFHKRVQQAGSIFWNGPLGLFEKQEFSEGTKSLAKSISQNKKAYRVVGGGHSALAVRDFEKEIDHVSTGGGASLYYLQGKGLPGLKSLLSEVFLLEEEKKKQEEEYLAEQAKKQEEEKQAVQTEKKQEKALNKREEITK